MKIVYIAYSILPSRTANSIQVMKMCQAFAQNGHDVVLLVPYLKNNKVLGIEDIFSFYGVNPCFKIIFLPSFPTIVGRFINGWLAAREAMKDPPDIVYCRDLVACYFATHRNMPVKFESHSPVRETNQGLVAEWIFQRIIRRLVFQKLVVISLALKDYYLNRYPSLNDKIIFAPDGADPVPEHTERVVLPNKGKRIQVGYVGHLYQGKGMEVISNLGIRCFWADFHIVGGNEEDITSWKKNFANYKNIFFHGFVPHSETNKFILSFDIVLLPNQKHVSVVGGGSDIGKWTSPMKLFEYMAAGKAIISSDLPVLREVLKDRENALLCDPEDVESWEKALLFLCENADERTRIGENAKKDFLLKYTWRKRAVIVLS